MTDDLTAEVIRDGVRRAYWQGVADMRAVAYNAAFRSKLSWDEVRGLEVTPPSWALQNQTAPSAESAATGADEASPVSKPDRTSIKVSREQTEDNPAGAEAQDGSTPTPAATDNTQGEQER